MVSSIASQVIRSEGVLDVDHGQEASSFMAPFKVNVIPGIGHVRRKILMEELNITLVRELAALDVSEGLKPCFRAGRRTVIHQRALGIDPPHRSFPPPPGPRSARRSCSRRMKTTTANSYG